MTDLTKPLRPHLSCVTVNLKKLSPYKNSNFLESDTPTTLSSGLEERIHKNDFLVSEESPSFFRPALYLFPRTNPDEPFKPIPTRKYFKRRQASEPMDTTDYGSDSEFSEWYDSSSDEEEYEGDSPRFNKRMSPAKDFLPDQYGNVLVSEFSGVPVSPSSSAKLKSALKSFGSHNRDSPSTDSPCSALSPSLSSSYSSPRSGRSSVQLVEPIEEISALKELRKSFRYIENANCARPVSGLPSSPRDGVKINESWGYKVFQRTPPATSSAARLKWEESKLNLR